MNLNKCLLAGRLTRDPELRYANNGNAIVSFTIAINRKWQTESAEKKEEVAYLDCKAFGRTAEGINNNFRKGSQILVEARAITEAWEDKQAKEKRSAIRFVVDHFHFVDSRSGGSEAPPSTSQPANRRAPVSHPPVDDSEPPF